MNHIPFLARGFLMLDEMRERNSDWENRILEDYRKTFSMPRKKKKAARKSLNRDYSICQWAKNQLIF